MTEATEVYETLQRLEESGAKANIGGFGESLEGYVKRILAEGSMTPNAELTSEMRLPLKSRITGSHDVRVDTILSIGIVLGTALERDVPANSDVEELFRDGVVELPEGDE